MKVYTIIKNSKDNSTHRIKKHDTIKESKDYIKWITENSNYYGYYTRKLTNNI